jgi:ribonuclease R
MTYTDVGAILEEGDKFLSDRYLELLDQFQVMEELSKILTDRRAKEGSIDFDLPEPDILLDIQGRPESIIKRERNVAHRIIEEFMLMANRTVAGHLIERNFPFLHRIHEPPDEDKLRDLVDFTLGFGCYSLVKRKITSKHLQDLLNEVKDRPEERLISTVVLRSMKQALYSEQNMGHFALAFKEYCHFTSPIRRYPDLVVHRMVRESLKHKSLPKQRREEIESRLESMAAHCSFRERNAEEAEREVVDGLKVRFMEDKVDQVYDGYITGATAYGLFVEIENFFIEGMIHVSSLEDDYYIFYEKDHLLKGQRKGKEYRLGDKVRVRVSGVNRKRGWIDFAILKKYKHDANRH